MAAYNITPLPPWGTLFTALTSANRLPTQRYTHCLPSAGPSWNRDSSMKSTRLQCASGQGRWAFAHWSQLRRWTAVRPWWGRWAPRWASRRRFLTVWAEIIWLCKPTVLSAVWVAGLSRSRRWSQMWRSWTSRGYTWSAVVRPGDQL
jgi:hypothetical protein